MAERDGAAVAEPAASGAAPASPTSRRDLCVALGCVAGAALVFWLFRDLRHDDAFITFRHARNIVRGDGFGFNPGERVLGTTTPLFTLLSALLWAVFGDGGLPTAAVAVNSLALGAQAFLLYLLLRDELPWTAAAVAALTLLGAFGAHNKLALETQTFAALLLVTVWALHRRRPVACGLALGLAFLTRYDAALLVPLVPLAWRGEGWRTALRPLLVAAVPVLPWLLFATLYFGSALPRTLGAKTGITPFLDYLAFYLDQFLRLPGIPPEALSRAAAAVLALLGVAVVARRLRHLAPLYLFAGGQWLVYAAIGPSPLQTWHMAVPHLAFALLILVGAFGSLEAMARGVAEPSGRRRWPLALLATAAVCWVLLLGASTYRSSRQIHHDFWLGERHARYSRVAEWVEANVRPRQTFLSIEVGTLGYLTDHRMIDPYGLVNPSNDYARRPGLDRLAALIFERQPDLVLVDSPFQGAELERHLPYVTVKVFPWVSPWSTLLVRRPEVLRDPSRLPALRGELPRRVPPPGAGGARPPAAAPRR